MTIQEMKQQLSALEAERDEYAMEQYRYGRMFPRMEQARLAQAISTLHREILYATIESGEYIPADELTKFDIRLLERKYGVLLNVSKDDFDGKTYYGLI